jgi:hypothetical protein
MGLAAPQFMQFGGVDTRSNPLGLPYGKLLRCRNIVPQADGGLMLRRGFVHAAGNFSGGAHPIDSATALTRIVSGAPEYDIAFHLSTTSQLRIHKVGDTGTPSLVTNHGGAAFTTDNPAAYVVDNIGFLHIYNGTDRLFYDGSLLRPAGLRAPTAGEVSGTTTAVGAADANGIPASTVGGAQPGYQFGIAIYNATTGMVGNFVKIGSRLVPGVASDINIATLPNYSGADTEWKKLIGRTTDGGEVIYAIVDASGNWVTVANATTSVTITQSGIDTDSPLPAENDVPLAFDKIAKAGDRLYGNLPNSPYIYKSKTAEDAVDSKFVGLPQQAFSGADIETFPTGEFVTCLGDFGDVLWAFSKNRLAILEEQPGQFNWQPTYETGCVGRFAFCKTPYGPVWLSDRLELCTMTDAGPVPVSDEYERGMLSRIASATANLTRIVYEKDSSKRIDRIVIMGIDSNGAAFHFYHDFNLRPGANPWEGQGYEANFDFPLDTAHVIIQVHDQGGTERVFAGGINFLWYQMSVGSFDGDVGHDYTGDAITLLNGGPDRPSLDYIEWYGDGNWKVSVGESLDVTPDQFEDLSGTIEAVPDGVHDHQWRVALAKEIKHLYVRCQLTTHDDNSVFSRINLLSNPGFESGMANWLPIVGVASISTASPFSGTRSLQIVQSSVGAAAYVFQAKDDGVTEADFPIHEGQVSTISAQCYRVSGDANIELIADIYDVDGNHIAYEFSPGIAASLGVWLLSTFTFTAPARSSFMRLRCYVTGGTGTVTTARFDEVSLAISNDLELNEPPHCPLESYGRMYMVSPLLGAARGHQL